MTLADHPRLRLMTLCVLYLAQGMPFGFVTVTLAAWLAERNVDVETVGALMALATLPWSFKWVWGPLIDSYGLPGMGRRRPWILLAQIFMAITIGTMMLIPDLVGQYRLLGWMILIHNCFASLQDVSVDALAVDLLTEAERGKANGLMYGSSYFGTFIGGAGLGWVTSVYSLRAALAVQALILLSIMLVPLLLRERAGDRLLSLRYRRDDSEPAVESIQALFRSLARAFSLRSTLLAAALAIGVKIGLGVLAAVAVVYFIQNLGWTQQQYSEVIGGGAVIVGLSGSVAGGFLADKVGAPRMARWAMTLLAFSWIVFAVCEPWWGDRRVVTAYIYVQEFSAAVMTVALFAIFMGVSWPVVAATQFTAYMALLNLSNTFGTWIAGRLQSLVAVDELFVLAGWLQLSLIPLLALIDPHEARLRLGGRTPGDGEGEIGDG